MKIRSALASGAVFILTFAIGLGMVEFALRVKNSSMTNYNIEMWRYAKLLKKPSEDPLLGHEHVPSSFATLQSVEIRTDADGLRGSGSCRDAPARRILFLGSSITLGWGVEEKKTMTSLLQARFTVEGKDVEVLNAGIGNYNTVRYVHRFLTRLKHLAPTDIVVNYFVNDAEELSLGGGNVLLRNSQLAVTLWTLVNMGMHRDMQNLVDHYKAVYEEDSPGYKAMVRSMEELAAYAQENRIMLYLLITPDIHQLQNYPLQFIHDKMAQLGERLGFEVVDTLETFSRYPAESIWAMPGDPHPNEVGHRIMADTLWPHLGLTQCPEVE